MNSITQHSQLLTGTVHCYLISMTCDLCEIMHQQTNKRLLYTLCCGFVYYVYGLLLTAKANLNAPVDVGAGAA